MNKPLNKMQFSIVINASREKVWRTMLEPEGYKAWTAEFAEGSYFEGSWDKGARIKFLTPGGEGMTSMIVDNKPYEFISIKHLGIIKDGIEDTQTVESKSWAEAYENYTLYERHGTTEVKVDLDVAPEWEEFMQNAWPKALARLKEICEGSGRLEKA